MNPKVSIIVPVYKAEKYLNRCLDSIIVQTFKDWELLLVDDGSPDNSGKLCDEYAQKDSRIKVFHKKNGGVSSARQMGLDNATGEYTIHADPDDWVEPTMLEELYAKTIEDKADMVICDYFTNKNNKQDYNCQQPKEISSRGVMTGLLTGLLYGSCWNKLIETKKIKNNQIRFRTFLNVCEDRQFIIEVLPNIRRVSYINKAFYHYTIGDNDFSLIKNNKKYINYKINKFFIDYVIENIKNLDEARNIYIERNLFYLVSSTSISSKVLRNEFSCYTSYCRNLSKFKYFVITSSMKGLKPFWFVVFSFYYKVISFLSALKKYRKI